MMSSVMPSLRYCCVGSAPKLTKGRTPIAGFGGPGLSIVGEAGDEGEAAPSFSCVLQPLPAAAGSGDAGPRSPAMAHPELALQGLATISYCRRAAPVSPAQPATASAPGGHPPAGDRGRAGAAPAMAASPASRPSSFFQHASRQIAQPLAFERAAIPRRLRRVYRSSSRSPA